MFMSLWGPDGHSEPDGCRQQHRWQLGRKGTLWTNPFRCHRADAEALPNMSTAAIVLAVQSHGETFLPKC